MKLNDFRARAEEMKARTKEMRTKMEERAKAEEMKPEMEERAKAIIARFAEGKARKQEGAEERKRIHLEKLEAVKARERKRMEQMARK